MHVFVDESRRRSMYLLATVRVRPAHLATVRRIVRGSLLGSQRRIHFVDERAGRRRRLLDVFCGLPIEAVAYRTVPAPTRRLVSYPRSPLTYEHLLPVEDPILWVADAFAWVAGAGGEWADRCGNVLGIVDIEP